MTRDEANGLLDAYVDGELDAAKGLELERYLESNPVARAACERLRNLSAAIRDQAAYHEAPAELAARLRASVPVAPETTLVAARRRWLMPAVALAAVAIVACAVAIGLLRPDGEERLAQEVLASHVRATLGNRLFDVASSDQHTVKPWMSSRLRFSPPVTDLSADGFELRGGRLDYVGGQNVAALVYQRRQHVIDAFVWPSRDERAAQALSRDGFNIERFARGGMTFWLVSDLNRKELEDFARLLAERSAL